MLFQNNQGGEYFRKLFISTFLKGLENIKQDKISDYEDFKKKFIEDFQKAFFKDFQQSTGKSLRKKYASKIKPQFLEFLVVLQGRVEKAFNTGTVKKLLKEEFKKKSNITSTEARTPSVIGLPERDSHDLEKEINYIFKNMQNMDINFAKELYKAKYPRISRRSKIIILFFGRKGLKRINQTIQSIKSLDGIDDIAMTSAQIVPGIAGPIIATGVLGFGIFFVSFAVMGMHKEYKEVLYNQKKAKAEAYKNLLRLKSLSDAKEDFNLILKAEGISFDSLKNLAKKPAETNVGLRPRDIEACVFEYYKLQKKWHLLRIEKRFGWAGFLGIGAMFTALFPSIAQSMLGIVQTNSAVIVSTISIIGNVGEGFFIAGQLILSIYAANRLIVGKKKLSDIQESIKNLEQSKSKELSESLKSILKETLDKRSKLIQAHSVRYGIFTILGQSCMFIGTIVSIFHLSLLISSPILVVGSIMCITCAIYRVIAELKEKNLNGAPDNNNYQNALDYADNYLAKYVTIEVYKYRGFGTGLDYYKSDLEKVSHQIAMIKAISLIRRISNKRALKNASVDLKYQELLAQFKSSINDDEIMGLKKSTLDKDIAKKLMLFISQNEKNIKTIFSYEQCATNQVLINNVLKCLKAESKFLDIKKVNFTQEQYVQSFKEQGFNMKLPKKKLQQSSKDLTKETVQMVKQSLKIIRSSHIDSITDMLKLKIIAERREKYIKDGSIGAPRKLEELSLVKESEKAGNKVQIWAFEGGDRNLDNNKDYQVKIVIDKLGNETISSGKKIQDIKRGKASEKSALGKSPKIYHSVLVELKDTPAASKEGFASRLSNNKVHPHSNRGISVASAF